MHSQHFKFLIAETIRLRDAYLNFSNDGAVSALDENQEKIRIFQILFHAELECYFEELALSSVLELETQLSTAGWNNPFIRSLLLYSPAEYTGNTAQIMPMDRIVHLISQLKMKIGSNNGIKEKNIIQIMLPAGIPSSLIPSTLIPNLESLGSARGHLAHKSKNTINIKLMRKDVLSAATQIISDTRALDKSYRKFKASPVPII